METKSHVFVFKSSVQKCIVNFDAKMGDKSVGVKVHFAPKNSL